MKKTMVIVTALLSFWGTGVLATETYVQKSYALNLNDKTYLNANPITLYLGQLLQSQYGVSISGLTLQKVVLVAKSENGGGTAALMINGTSVAKATVPGTAANFTSSAPSTFFSVTLNNTNLSGDTSWQINLDGNQVVSTATLVVNVPTSTSKSYTGWPLQFIETDLTSAYPGIQYYSRFAVTGGLYPYTFKLLEAPTGMQIQTRTGEIKWTPPANATSATVEVQVTDSAGTTAPPHSYTIKVTTSGFYFINAVTGNDSNTGALGHAFKTLLGVQSKKLPMTATLYFMAGTYPSTGIQMNEMPGLWMAYPGATMPVLDCQAQKFCIGLNGLIKYPTLFQGLNFTNVEYEYFSVNGNTYPITWRNNIMNNLNVTNASDSTENPTFIFTVGTGAGAVTAEPPPEYQHLVIQNNQFYDLQNSFAARTSPYVFYQVAYSLVEDNVAHDANGNCGEDKQNGWFNTLRHNVCYDIKAYGLDLLADDSSGQEEIDHNLYIGSTGYGSNAVALGNEPGFIQDVYVHNNTFVNGTISFGGEVTGANSGNLVIKNNIFYDDGTGTLASFYNIGGTLSPADLPASANVNDNIYWGPATLSYVIWNYGTVKTSLTTWLSYGFDLDSLFTEPALSPTGDTMSDYSLSPTNPNYGVYGKDFSAGVWQ